MFKGINWIGVIVADVVYFGLAFAWFGPVGGPLYRQLMPQGPSVGFDATALIGFLIGLVIMTGLAWVLVRTGARTLGSAVLTALVVTIAFDTTVYAGFAMTGQPPRLMAFFAAFDLVAFAVGAVVLTLLKGKTAEV